MIDSSKHQGQRKRLVDNLINKGIDSAVVIKALLKVPRHVFIDSDFESYAYLDKAFPIDSNQTISQPYTVAFQTSLLNLVKSDKVLEIGTGSGYQTAILMEICKNVFTIERQHRLYRKTKKLLSKLNYQSYNIFYGDGYKGLDEKQPFDKILVTAGAEEIPKKLLIQLKVGGIMVIPVGKNVQEMIVVKRISKLKFEKENHGSFKFVPLLKDLN
ncbi:protein-L-isoaspartate(D-aspartate) O-methyltransferase [Flavobacteriaceae bacterium]|jgi:protein-L-isoaspartate(D-aspartate) O-methyltransferase|nr:protein-L-isoaspartate(D-aspartate) O-methyltransferase [Flavobacteriaceae bacterium]MBT5233036.1 protein-L-isoaspartate(D-aspartate) O-methyltransferase [Flavobacteriaceae bacterium]MBT5493166.1 protein-L-isoaspartate(D-aspartate) O-methyltransferase [Flavobacteriaceae bacterium]MBT6654314.1 protein-L-isoaspartate(D-aspartate) O-methyltransferase [Flavobacteriaceae bacterium]MBT7573116.1 protein-L-isoaspartate(D-aspartate) O-methyltransferase [Flavobacteriaceae bacterium]|tara:strand:- start:1981 stop:2622 length:642 start_codon:yes stop_codon:yes gene_type:complete